MSTQRRRGPRKPHYTTAGITLIGFLVLVAVFVAGQFTGAFVDSVRVTLLTSRTGLNLDPGGRVKLLDVQVGRVGKVTEADGYARVELDIFPDQAKRIPANVGATIDSTTVFGAKFVALQLPANSSPESLSSGATIDNRTIAPELNTLFERLTGVLRAVSPENLNATLTAISDAFRGRGEQVGHTLEAANTYLNDLRPSLDNLQRDLRATAEVTDIYADAAPDIVRTLDALTTTGSTVVEKADGLDQFFLAASSFGNSAGKVLDSNGESIQGLMTRLVPTTRLLEKYSSGFPCFFQGADIARASLEPVIGGTVPGLNLSATVLAGEMPYRYPQDLPKISAGGGPYCGNLPVVDNSNGRSANYLVTDTGVNPYAPTDRPAQLNVLDFMLYGVPGGQR
ncbi:MCE family protein [Nocardia gamkensis]|uniref:MCE family protein n=1 Tax=Nocardia gamkensis TaxID=352869 RepID=UPI0037C50FE7